MWKVFGRKRAKKTRRDNACVFVNSGRCDLGGGHPLHFQKGSLPWVNHTGRLLMRAFGGNIEF